VSSLKTMDLLLVDELFERENERGYVLDFSDRTFAEYFARELGVDIDDPDYAVDGRGKLRRLRRFLKVTDDATVVRTLRALWDYREAKRARFEQEERVANAHVRLLDLIHRLEGGKPTPPPTKPVLAVDAVRLAELRDRLIAVSQLEPQPRGLAFEPFRPYQRPSKER
jgi:hypothetical protein